MSLSSWLRELLARRVPPPNERRRRVPRRRPTHSRPFLEHLEERTLPDASSAVIPSADHPAFNSALVSGGFVTPTAPSTPRTTDVTSTVFPSSGGASSLAVTSSFPDQDQPGAQFRDFGVNSQGVGSPFSQTTSYVLLDAYGFGSGVAPNAPWMPSAYNLGLANHQFNYPSQSDLGFQSPPPWSRAIALPAPDDQPQDVGDATPSPQQPLILPSPTDHSDERSGLPPAEQSAAEEAAPNYLRGDPAFEQALFTDFLPTRTAVLDDRLADGAWQLPAEILPSMPSGTQGLD